MPETKIILSLRQGGKEEIIRDAPIPPVGALVKYKGINGQVKSFIYVYEGCCNLETHVIAEVE